MSTFFKERHVEKKIISFHLARKTKKYCFCSVDRINSVMDNEILKRVIADNEYEVPNYQIIKRDFTFEKFGNYVFVGIRR